MRAFDYWVERIPGLTPITYTVRLAEPSAFSKTTTLADTNPATHVIRFNTKYFTTSYSDDENTQIRGGDKAHNLTQTMIHEAAHDLLIGEATWLGLLQKVGGGMINTSANNGPVEFTGSIAKSVYGTNVPVYSDGPQDGSSLVHPNTLHGNMNASDEIDQRPFFSEVELAILKDLGHNSIDLKKSFGESYYQYGGNANVYGNGPFIETEDNTTFNSSFTYGIGLHVVSGGHIIAHNGDLIASGYAGAGIRLENSEVDPGTVAGANIIIIGSNTNIKANGEESVGVLMYYDYYTTLTNNGNIEATGKNGRGIWIQDSFALQINNTGTIDVGKGNDAIYVDKNSTIGRINIMTGSNIIGNIVSNNADKPSDSPVPPIVLTFGTDGDTNFNFTYEGDIKGTGSFDIQTWNGYTWLAGNTLDRFNDVLVKSNSTLDFEGGGTVTIYGKATTELYFIRFLFDIFGRIGILGS